VPSSVLGNLKPRVLGACVICIRLLILGSPFPGFCLDQHDAGATEAGVNLTGTWQQNSERCLPPPRNKAYTYKMTVEASDKTLRVHVIANNGRGERKLDLTYEIGGKELVYTGMDGDEYHTKVHWNGDSLVFTTVEHERGRSIPSQETWTLIDAGHSLERVKMSSGLDEESKNVCVLERLP